MSISAVKYPARGVGSEGEERVRGLAGGWQLCCGLALYACVCVSPSQSFAPSAQGEVGGDKEQSAMHLPEFIY